MISVLLVDDDPMVCTYLATILAGTEGIEVVGRAHDGAAAVEATVRTRPDVVLMDVRMPGVDGITATARIVRLGSPSRVVALTSFEDGDAVLAALDAGAVGFLLKTTAPEDLAALVRAAASGHTVLAPEASVRLLAGRPGTDPVVRRALADLTPRETDVLRRVGAGRSNAQIAHDLGLSEATVKGHVSRVLDKLGCANRTQAGLLAHEHLRPPGRPGGSSRATPHA